MNGVTLPSYASNSYLYGPDLAAAPAAAPATVSPFSVLLAQSPLPQPSGPPQSALDALRNISAGGSRNDTPYGGPGPQGLRGTGNPLTDIPAAVRAIGPQTMSAIANPMGLPGSVIGGLIGAAARGIAGIPNPTSPQLGLQAAARGIQEAMFGITPEEQARRSAYAQLEAIQNLEAAGTDLGYGGLSPEGAAAAAEVSQGIAAGFGPESGGYGSPSADANSVGTDGDTDSGPGGLGEAKRGGLATLDGFKGPEKFAQGGAVIELQGGGKVAVGPGGGLDDLIPTSINGRRAAALSDGEFVMPADVVSMMGDGSSNAGARRLYDLVRQIREAKTGTSRQAGPLPVGEILKRTMS